jgi:hypothetical protein
MPELIALIVTSLVAVASIIINLLISNATRKSAKEIIAKLQNSGDK